MPDLEKLPEGFEETTGYKEEEKLGAPKIDASELEGLLGDEPAVWTGSGAEKRGAPVLEEQVELDAPEMSWQQDTAAAPHGAPVLEESAADLLGEEPAAYDPVADFCEKLQFDEALKAKFVTLDAEQQMQVVKMRAQGLGIPEPMIPNELRPKIEEALPEAEEVALEEAPVQEEYVPQFKDEDAERAKEEAKKPRAYQPPQQELTEEQKQESRRMMAQLREERERELAAKGFKTLIIMAIVGVVGAICFSIFFSGAFGLSYKMEEELGWMKHIKSYAPLLGIAIGLGSVALIAPVPALKGVSKFLDGLGFVLMLFPGIPLLLQKDGHGLLNGLFYGIAILALAASVFVLTTSDSVAAYNKHGNAG
ncbi:MAG: hypothetical protein IJ055_10110 [Oscillospiraceae bacterium]|nr:hypothetical protein [Oscillospiraceae bacterium]